MVTCKDIARIANVSTATVTRAFNPNSSIKEDTRQKIHQIAKDYSYTPNLAARSLKQQSTKIVGFVLCDASNPYYVKVAQYIERRLEHHGFRSLLTFSSRDSVSISRSLEVMMASRVNGVIFPPEDDATRGLVEAMQKQGTCFMQLYRNPFPHIDHVLNNNIYGAYIGTRHLLECGHRRILYVSTDTDKRDVGFWQAVNEQGVDPSEVCALSFGKNDEVNRARLQQTVDRMNPTAIFSVADTPSRIVFHFLWYRGYRIPEDISLLVNDSLDWCEMLNISVIAHPYEELANAATDMLIDRIQRTASSDTQEKIVTPYLISRQSVIRL